MQQHHYRLTDIAACQSFYLMGPVCRVFQRELCSLFPAASDVKNVKMPALNALDIYTVEVRSYLPNANLRRQVQVAI